MAEYKSHHSVIKYYQTIKDHFSFIYQLNDNKGNVWQQRADLVCWGLVEFTHTNTPVQIKLKNAKHSTFDAKCMPIPQRTLNTWRDKPGGQRVLASTYEWSKKSQRQRGVRKQNRPSTEYMQWMLIQVQTQLEFVRMNRSMVSKRLVNQCGSGWKSYALMC